MPKYDLILTSEELETTVNVSSPISLSVLDLIGPRGNAGYTSVVEYSNLASFPATGEAAVFYLAVDTVNYYRWNGSSYDLVLDTSKLAGIEALADVTDTTNVTAAGAVMDSELTSEASVKALDQGVATTDSPTFAGLTVDTNTLHVDATNNRVGIGTTTPATELDVTGTVTADGLDVGGNITVSGTVDGRDVATDGTKLDGIESGATADQTGSEIKTVLFAEADTNNFTDTLLTKLNGIEDNADVTDTANVTAAGALMDSEVTNLSQVKAFDSSDYATAAQGALADTAVQPNDSPTFGTITANTFSFANWTVTESGGSLYFATGGTNKMKLDASGNLQVVGNVESNATIS